MEYQAKELFAKHGVPVFAGETVDNPADARAAAERIGKPVMVKAQVKAGGRGKAGGGEFCPTPDEAEAPAPANLKLVIKEPPPPKGLVTQAAGIDQEDYVSF